MASELNRTLALFHELDTLGFRQRIKRQLQEQFEDLNVEAALSRLEWIRLLREYNNKKNGSSCALPDLLAVFTELGLNKNSETCEFAMALIQVIGGPVIRSGFVTRYSPAVQLIQKHVIRMIANKNCLETLGSKLGQLLKDGMDLKLSQHKHELKKALRAFDCERAKCLFDTILWVCRQQPTITPKIVKILVQHILVPWSCWILRKSKSRPDDCSLEELVSGECISPEQIITSMSCKRPTRKRTLTQSQALDLTQDELAIVHYHKLNADPTTSTTNASKFLKRSWMIPFWQLRQHVVHEFHDLVHHHRLHRVELLDLPSEKLDANYEASELACAVLANPHLEYRPFQFCWDRYLETKSDKWIDRWTDLVIELKITPQLCLRSFQTLVNYTLLGHIDDIDDSQLPSLLRSIASIVIYRHSVLVQFNNEYDELLIKIASKFNCPDIWINNIDRSSGWVDSPLEKQMTVQFLRVLGIASMDNIRASKDDVLGINEHHISSALMPLYSSIRNWMEEMAPSLAGEFLIETNERQSLQQSIYQNLWTHKVEKIQTRATGPSINELLPEEIIRCIFGFLGHKRLLKCRAVCRSWNTPLLAMNPVLWKRLFELRWPNLIWSHHAISKGTATPDYMAMFRDRTQTWKTKCRGRYSKKSDHRLMNAYHHHICPYAGCVQVLRSLSQYQKHVEIHERKIAKMKIRVKSAPNKKHKTVCK